MPSIDVEKYTSEHAQFFDDIVPPLVRRCLSDASPKTILDAGCGEGGLVRRLASHHRDGRTLLACDLSPSRVKRLGDEVSGVKAFVDDVQDLREVEDGSIDLFISSQVIEHVDDVRMIATIERVTRRGSNVFISTVLKRWYGWYFYRSPCGWALDPTHLREYRTEAELLDKFPTSAFRLLGSEKTRISYPVTDSLFRVLRTGPEVYARSRVARGLRALRVPIIGYQSWDLLFERI